MVVNFRPEDAGRAPEDTVEEVCSTFTLTPGSKAEVITERPPLELVQARPGEEALVVSDSDLCLGSGVEP